MTVRMAIGYEFFDDIRRRGGYYVDKTELVYELLHDARTKVALFTRPRRFGKTLNMTMVESFLDIRRDSHDAFEGLAVTRHEAFCEEWMNSCPVLFVSLKDAEGLTFESAYGMLKVTLANACKKHAYLGESEKVIDEDRDVFKRLIGNAATDDDVRSSLLTLTRMMHAHFGRPAVLLIDEYDVPLAKAAEEKEGGERYYPRMLEVVRSLMSTALKSNDSLELAVVTGCLRIAKESIFTGVNNFATYSVLDSKFSRYFGFTQDELDGLLRATGLEDKRAIFKQWYDGYIFGNEAVYCPWDVVNYADALLYDPAARPKNYWKNTSGNGVIRDFVERKEFHVKQRFETLLNGGTVTQAISEGLTYDTLHETEGNLWSVLIMTGYLTKADPAQTGDEVALRIPNREVAGVFQDTVAKLFSDHVDTSRQRALMDALWAGDEEAASKALSDFLWQTISYNDYHEDYYHAFLAGLFVGREYAVESNRESGLGRPDIRLYDDDNRRALVIEAKCSPSADQMEADCERALRQIEEGGYTAGLEDYDVTCYGVAFHRKTALARKL